METLRQILQVARRDINYIRLTLESYDGMVLVRTVDPFIALIELSIAPGCEHFINQILDDLRANEEIRIEPDFQV